MGSGIHEGCVRMVYFSWKSLKFWWDGIYISKRVRWFFYYEKIILEKIYRNKNFTLIHEKNNTCWTKFYFFLTCHLLFILPLYLIKFFFFFMTSAFYFYLFISFNYRLFCHRHFYFCYFFIINLLFFMTNFTSYNFFLILSYFNN